MRSFAVSLRDPVVTVTFVKTAESACTFFFHSNSRAYFLHAQPEKVGSNMSFRQQPPAPPSPHLSPKCYTLGLFCFFVFSFPPDWKEKYIAEPGSRRGLESNTRPNTSRSVNVSERTPRLFFFFFFVSEKEKAS